MRDYLEIIHKRSKSVVDRAKAVVNSIKKNKERTIDRLFHDAHDAIVEKVDCLTCANCCKTISPIVTKLDIQRLASFLNVKEMKLIDAHFEQEKDGTYFFKIQPCVFLVEDNYCAVYQARPKACREYPHTNRVNMFQILNLTYKNSSYCPIVFDVLEMIANQKKI